MYFATRDATCESGHRHRYSHHRDIPLHLRWISRSLPRDRKRAIVRMWGTPTEQKSSLFENSGRMGLSARRDSVV
jgi:hypothetical protein